jgi:hypothetical protein
MGRSMGIEPTNARATIWCVNHFATIAMMVEREGFEPSKLSQRIYSPPHLTTLVSLHVFYSHRRPLAATGLILSWLPIHLKTIYHTNRNKSVHLDRKEQMIISILRILAKTSFFYTFSFTNSQRKRHEHAKKPIWINPNRLGFTLWCGREDSNFHGLPHTPLKRARLPFRHDRM